MRSSGISPPNLKKSKVENAENISPIRGMNKKQNALQFSDEKPFYHSKEKSRNHSASPAKVNPQIQSSQEQLQNLEQQRIQCKLKGNQLQGVLQNLHNKLKMQSDDKRSPNKIQNTNFFSSKKHINTDFEYQKGHLKNLEEQIKESEQDKKQLIESIRQYKINFDKLQCLYSSLQIKYEVDSTNEHFICEMAKKIGELLTNIQNSQHKALQINLKDLKLGQQEKYTNSQLLLIQKICDLIETTQAKVRNQEFLLIDLQQSQLKLQNELNSFKEKNYHLQNIVSSGDGYSSYAQTFLESPTAKKMIFVLENELKIKDDLVNNLMSKVQGNEDNTLKLCDQILSTIDKTCTTQDNFHENLTRILENQKSEIELKNKHIQDLNQIISKYKSYFKIIQQEVSIYEELQLNNIQFNKQNFDKLIDLVDNMDQKIKIITYENLNLKENANLDKLQEINLIERQYFESDLNFKKDLAVIQNQYEFETKFLEIIQEYAKLGKQHVSQETVEGIGPNPFSTTILYKIDQDVELMKRHLLDIELQIDGLQKDALKGIYFTKQKIESAIKPLSKQMILNEKTYQFGQSPQSQGKQQSQQQQQLQQIQSVNQQQNTSIVFQQQNGRTFSPIPELSSEQSLQSKSKQIPQGTKGKFVLQVDCIIGLKSDKIVEKIKATHIYLKVYFNNQNLFITQKVPIDEMKFNRTYEVYSLFDNPIVRIEIWMVCEPEQKEIYFSECLFDESEKLEPNIYKIIQSKIINYPGCLYFKVKFLPDHNQKSNDSKKQSNDPSESFTEDIRRLLPQINQSENMHQSIRNSGYQAQNMSDLLYEDSYKKSLVHSSMSERSGDKKLGITPAMIKYQKSQQNSMSQNKSNMSAIFERDDQNQQLDNTPSFIQIRPKMKSNQIQNLSSQLNQYSTEETKQAFMNDDLLKDKLEILQFIDNYKSENQFLQPQNTNDALKTPKLKALE